MKLHSKIASVTLVALAALLAVGGAQAQQERVIREGQVKIGRASCRERVSLNV